MKQYFETVDVATGELPEGEACALNEAGEMLVGLLSKCEDGTVYCESKDRILLYVVYYLRPISLSEHDREVAGKAFKRAYALGHEGGCIEGTSGYYVDACWQTYKKENNL